MKKLKLLILLIIVAGQIHAQGSPEKFSSEFINGLMNYKEENMKRFLPEDREVQPLLLAQLKEMSVNEFKPAAKTCPNVATSIRAVLKDGDGKHEQLSDILIDIDFCKQKKYRLILWGCYVQNGKWQLGEKIELKK